jgi:hypothetical protein
MSSTFGLRISPFTYHPLQPPVFTSLTTPTSFHFSRILLTPLLPLPQNWSFRTCVNAKNSRQFDELVGLGLLAGTALHAAGLGNQNKRDQLDVCPSQ